MLAVRRSITLPIVLGSIAVALSLAMLVGWTLLIARYVQLAPGAGERSTWLLVTGLGAYATIVAVLVLFSVFLVREILEVRRQTSFIDSVTHELRSPLASIKLATETLGREELGAEQREELREMMLDDIERLSMFVDDVLQASRLEYRRREGHDLRTVRLRDLVEHCVEQVCRRHRVDPERIAIHADADAEMTTDETAIETVVKNLLDNAVKYSDEPVDVRVTVTRDAREVTIAVQDRGIGIPHRDLQRVAQRFYRVPDEAVRARRGTGLGLFVVSRLVRKLGGRLVPWSDGPGTGTTMTVRLPVRN